jgi:hypothetical protein
MSVLDECETCAHLSAALMFAIQPPHRHCENCQLQFRTFLCTRRYRAFRCRLAAHFSTTAARFSPCAVPALSDEFYEASQFLIGKMLDVGVMRFADKFLFIRA